MQRTLAPLAQQTLRAHSGQPGDRQKIARRVTGVTGVTGTTARCRCFMVVKKEAVSSTRMMKIKQKLKDNTVPLGVILFGICIFGLAGATTRYKTHQSYASIGVGSSISDIVLPDVRLQVLDFVNPNSANEKCCSITCNYENCTIDTYNTGDTDYAGNAGERLLSRKPMDKSETNEFLRGHPEAFIACSKLSVWIFDSFFGYRGTFNVFYENTKITGSEKPAFRD